MRSFKRFIIIVIVIALLAFVISKGFKLVYGLKVRDTEEQSEIKNLKNVLTSYNSGNAKFTPNNKKVSNKK